MSLRLQEAAIGLFLEALKAEVLGTMEAFFAALLSEVDCFGPILSAASSDMR